MVSGTMKALVYDEPRKFSVKQVPIPQINDDEILLKILICGFCGTDGHIHEGDFNPKFPLIPGHEGVGTVVEMGKNVEGFKIGDRVAADVGTNCGHCHYCRRGEPLLCTNFEAAGVRLDGAFAEYIKYPFSKCSVITKLSDEDATLLEPASCAVHGMDKLKMPFGSKCLLIGAGPTGLILAQLMKIGGASSVTIAANAGLKMDLARKIGAADHYIDLDRTNATSQWAQIKKDNPYGFDVVAECTGVESIINDSINYVARGGTLLVYGVYEDDARVKWSPSQIFGNELRIIGSFSQVYCFPRAVELLESGKVNVKGMVTDVYTIDQWQEALDKMNSRKALKIAIRPN
ncbi:N-terminal acetyltransferase A complex catalytic subunit ard1 [Apiotrichum porosum]|uniref:N-terminal acetyltransferase A complex catalytic subunit ard1 n=1 Tax=Apiotrichum porosum TaxID=105984 RepID=A0A427XCZ7_9TREE|nr:N-terminal acetyltransferase A complex catalytic subunit ard1 [Apiotrichum porosum]RSH76594.1 N-terminal acetyltransferase A complex catalytic subunit ard1 [Apiotrichum porosum]